MSGESALIGIDQKEIEAIVRRILDGADLSQTTGKIVRQKVLGELGERASSDMRALKRSIRDALSVVLKNEASSVVPSGPPGPSEKVHESELKAEQKPEEVQDNETNGDMPAAKITDTIVEEPERMDRHPPSEAVDASGHDADVEDEIENEKGDFRPREIKISIASGKKRRSRIIAEEDEDDDDFSPDHEDTNLSPSRTGKPNNFTPRPSRPKISSETATKSSRAKKTGSPRNSPGRPAKRARSNLASTDKDLEKLRSVCRQLGCMAPPSRMRGKTIPEKCEAVLEYLRQKGIDVPNPTLMTRKDIALHRSRLEQEKELAGLDTSNIIEDGRRSRRRNAPMKASVGKTEELPSDVSGEELSASSAHDEDSDEYQASSVESE